MTILRAAPILIAITFATAYAGKASYYEEGIAARKAAARLPAMRHVYIDPCESPAKLRRWWKPLATRELEAARVELEHYRNIMDCKGILIYDVPDYARENEFWKALDAGDAGKAKQLGAALRDSAERVIIDVELIARRYVQVRAYADDTSLPQTARTRLNALLLDVRSEVRAKRYVSASLVLNTAFGVALAAGASRPQNQNCSSAGDPARGC